MDVQFDNQFINCIISDLSDKTIPISLISNYENNCDSVNAKTLDNRNNIEKSTNVKTVSNLEVFKFNELHLIYSGCKSKTFHVVLQNVMLLFMRDHFTFV